MTGRPRAAIYCRISRDPTGNELGVRRQEKDCRALADQRGWTVAEVFVDDDRSAYSGKPRPSYLAMLAAVTEGRCNAIVAWHPDRLQRSPRELEDFIDLIERTRCKVATVQAGEYDLATPSGRMSARIVGAVARGESEHKSARLRRKHLELAETGRPHGGRRPIGFAPNQIDHDPAEAKAIREAADMVLDGASLQAAARHLLALGVLRGLPDSAGAMLKRILVSPRIAGLREHKGEIIGPAVWEPIIDRATWERLRAILTRPGRYSVPIKRTYVLSNLVVCECGVVMRAQPRRTESPQRWVYACLATRNGCGRCAVDGDRLEEFVLAETKKKIADRTVRRALQRHLTGEPDRAGEILEAIAVDERRLAALAAEVGEASVSIVEWKAMRQPINDRIEANRALLAKQGRALPRVDVTQLPTALDGADRDELRRLLPVFVHDITVHRVGRGARRFNSDRVSIRWAWD